MEGGSRAIKSIMYKFVILAVISIHAVKSCPTAPVVLYSALAAACSSEPAQSAIGCSMYRFCNSASLRPAIFPSLCTTLRIAGSLCNDDAAVSSIPLCNQLRTQYANSSEFRSCLPPYPISSTSGIKALHFGACDDMEGYSEPMAGCDTCTRASCPDPLASLSAGCIGMPMNQCDGLYSLCALGASALCGRNLREAPPRPPSPPPESASVSPAPPGAVPCITNSSMPQCAQYLYPAENIIADLDSLCNDMPYMPGCTILFACQANRVTGDFCRPMTLLATICYDMPGMGGCRSYNQLCRNTSAVQQCRQFPAIPGLPTTAIARRAVLGGVCLPDRTDLSPALQNLTTTACQDCGLQICPDYMTPLATLCKAFPDLSGCSAHQVWCNASAAWESASSGSSIAVFCRRPPQPPSPPPSLPTCVVNSSLSSCASFEYPLANIAAEIDSLCRAMPYMPGCTIRDACQAGRVTGNFCRPMTLLATICYDMPSMSGCRAYVLLCTNTSAVQQCRQFPAIPGLPTTMDARRAIITGFCNGNTTGMSAVVVNLTRNLCASCTPQICNDYLTPLSTVCSISPRAAGCSTYTSWCIAAAAWETSSNTSMTFFCKKSPPPPQSPSSKPPSPRPRPPSPSSRSPPVLPPPRMTPTSRSPPPAPKPPSPRFAPPSPSKVGHR